MDFSRNTIIEGVAIIEKITHDEIDRLLLRFGLEEVAPREGASKYGRANEVSRYLIQNPEEKGPNGGNLTFEMLEYIIGYMEQLRTYPIKENFPQFVNSLKRDGYLISNGELQSILPGNTELPERENELNLLLANFSFEIAKGHLEQAISAHTRGDWASCNAQLRTFVECLFDSIAEKLEDSSKPLLSGSHQKREYLAKLAPPFFLSSLNEWEIGGKGGFVQGFWKRLHPEGSHPGLSDEEDCTYRLHLVILTAHHFLKRFVNRL